MIRNIDISLLRAFIAVADCGGITSASRQLHLTQAAVSQQIKRLEETFDCQLFDRTKKKVARTHDGDRLYGKAKTLLALNDDIVNEMTRPDIEGTITMGVPHDIVGFIMPSVIRKFHQAWPRVQLSMHCSSTFQLLEELHSGEIDLTLTTEIGTPEKAIKLYEDELVWVGAENGTAHRKKPLRVVIEDSRCAFREPLRAVLDQFGDNWISTIEAASSQAAIAHIEADISIGVLLRSCIPPGIKEIDHHADLPKLPVFHVNLHCAPSGLSDIARELEIYIRATILEKGIKTALVA